MVKKDRNVGEKENDFKGHRRKKEKKNINNRYKDNKKYQ